MRTLGQNQERDDHGNPAAKCHLEQPVERRFDWAFADLACNQEHDRAGEGSGAKLGLTAAAKARGAMVRASTPASASVVGWGMSTPMAAA